MINPPAAAPATFSAAAATPSFASATSAGNITTIACDDDQRQQHANRMRDEQTSWRDGRGNEPRLGRRFFELSPAPAHGGRGIDRRNDRQQHPIFRQRLDRADDMPRQRKQQRDNHRQNAENEQDRLPALPAPA